MMLRTASILMMLASSASANPLALGTPVESQLRPEEMVRYPLALDAANYHIELFVRAPGGCTAAPDIRLTMSDRDDALVGPDFDVSTRETVSWQKGESKYRAAAGLYTITLRAGKRCAAQYRLRVTRI